MFHLVRGSAYFLLLVHWFCDHVYIHCAYLYMYCFFSISIHMFLISCMQSIIFVSHKDALMSFV